MFLIKAICFVGVAIGLWIMAPVIGALAGTVGLIIAVRFVLKEDADVRRSQTGKDS